MHWWQPVLAAVTALASWRWAVRPIRRGWRRLMDLLEQIRDSSGGVQKLAREMEAMSGALVQFATQILDRQQDHEGRLTDLGDLYVDLVATVARNRKRIERLEPRDDDTDPGYPSTG